MARQNEYQKVNNIKNFYLNELSSGYSLSNNKFSKIILKENFNYYLKEISRPFDSKNDVPLENKARTPAPITQVDADRIALSFSTTVTQYQVFTTPSYQFEALRQYTLVMQSAERQPAILYKLRDVTSLMFICGDALDAPGRIYKPRVHTWALNSVWMLAHIHRQSKFMVVSPVTANTVMRLGAPQRYSAFAREISTAMLAGYKVTKLTYQYHRQVAELSPTNTPQAAAAVTIMDCRADNEACHLGMALYQTSIDAYQMEYPTLAPAPAPLETIPGDEALSDLVLSGKLEKVFGTTGLGFFEKFNNLDVKKEFWLKKIDVSINYSKNDNNLLYTFFKNKIEKEFSEPEFFKKITCM